MNAPSKRSERLGEIGLQNFTPYLMNRIIERYNENLRTDLVKAGMTTPKIRAMAVLSVVDGLLIGELAIYAVVEKSTMSRTLDKLEAEGAVRREIDLGDQRATRIFITDSGRATFEQIWPAMAENYAAMFRDIPEDGRAAFVSALQKILRNIRRHEL